MDLQAAISIGFILALAAVGFLVLACKKKPTSRDDTPVLSMKRLNLIGQTICAVVALTSGVGGLLTGRAGYRFAHAQGLNVRLGAIMILVGGVWLLHDLIMKIRKSGW